MSWSAGREGKALSRYLREIRNYPLLNKEDEQRLVRELEQGDPEAGVRLVQSNLSFVVKVAAEYRSLGVPFEDLLNEGNMGLIEAARRFDGGKGTRFITYAIWWIRKSILKAIADHSQVVRIPSYRRKKISELKSAERDLNTRLGRAPSREELADQLALSVAQVDRFRGQQLGQASLDRPMGEDGAASMWEFLVDDSVSVEEQMLSRETGLLVAEAFNKLPHRHQEVMVRRLGLSGQPQQTLKEISARLGVSRERVRQIEEESKNRLRRSYLSGLRKKR